MMSLYVSPSTEPKTGGLAAIGLSKDLVGEWKRGDRKLKETVVADDD